MLKIGTKTQTRYSRRKYAEAVACLKGAIKNPGLPWVQRLHAVQLLFVVYELPLPESIAPSTRQLKVVKELLEQRGLERQLLQETRSAESTHLSEEIERERSAKAMADTKAFLLRFQATNATQEKEVNDEQ